MRHGTPQWLLLTWVTALAAALPTVWATPPPSDGAAPAPKPGLAVSAASRPQLQEEDAERVQELVNAIGKLRRAANYAEAIPLAEELLEIRLAAQGDDWWETGDAKRLVATLKHIASLDAEAQGELAQRDVVDQRVYSPDHQIQYADALELLTQTLAIQERLLPINSVEIARTAKAVAVLTANLNRHSEAETLYRRALAMYRRALSEKHPDLGELLQHFAGLLRTMSQPAEAESLIQRALAIQRACLGNEHVQVAQALNELGAILYQQGDYAGAGHAYREAYAMREALLSAGNVFVVTTTLNNFAQLLQETGDLKGAHPLFCEALSLRLRVFGLRHRYVGNSWHNLGALQMAMGDYESAERAYRRALAIRRRRTGDNDPRLGNTLSKLGEMLAYIGEKAEAEAVLREAVEIQRRRRGEDHYYVAVAMKHLGEVLHNKGDPEAGESLLRRALAICRGPHGAHPVRMARAMGNLGLALESRPETMDEAESLYTQAVAILRKKKHPKLAGACTRYGDFLVRRRGRPGVAVELYAEAIEVIERQRLRAAGDELDRSRYFSMLAKTDPYGGMVRALLASRSDKAQGSAGAGSPGRPAIDGSTLPSRRGGESHDIALAITYLERGRGRALLDLLHRGAVDLYALGLRRAEGEGTDAITLGIRVAHQQALDAAAERRTAADRIAATHDDHGISEGQKNALIAKFTMQREEALDRERQAVRTLREFASEELARTAGQPRRCEQVAAGLEPNEVLLAYDVGEDGTALLVVWPNRAEAIHDSRASSARSVGSRDVQAFTLRWPDGRDVDRQSLQASVDRFYATLFHQPVGVVDRPDRRSHTAGGMPRGGEPEFAAVHPEQALFSALVPSGLREAVMAASRVLIVPDGPLHELPFETLIVESRHSVRWIDVGPSIVYGPSGTVLMDRRRHAALRRNTSAPPPATTLLAVGDPVFARADERTSEPAEPSLPDSGVVLTLVLADSNAARHGLRDGDVLLAYAGNALATSADLSRCIARLQPPDGAPVLARDHAGEGEVTVTVWRNGRTFDRIVATGKLGAYPSKAPMPRALIDYRDAVNVCTRRDAAPRPGTPVSNLSVLPQLPGTRVEIDALVKLLRSHGKSGASAVRVLTGEDATVTALFQAVDGPRYLHFATHALAEGGLKVYESALALTRPKAPTATDDGFLRLGDLLAGWEGKLQGTELVTLSACSTARGQLEAGEGFVALTWGFLYAGAESVVASLWKVDDTATALLMTRLYENLLGAFEGSRELSGKTYIAGEPMPKSEALHEAKQWLRHLDTGQVRSVGQTLLASTPARGAEFVAPKRAPMSNPDKPYADPFYWGAFVLVGDGL